VTSDGIRARCEILEASTVARDSGAGGRGGIVTPGTKRWTAVAAVLAVALVTGTAVALSRASLAGSFAAEPPAVIGDPTTAAPLEPAPGSTSPAAGSAILSYLGVAPDGSVEAGGYAEGPEEGASCTLVLRLAGEERRADVPGTADATTLQCGGLSIPADQLTAGAWTAQLIILTPSRLLESEPTTIEVP
jgi:hypothetical protein